MGVKDLARDWLVTAGPEAPRRQREDLAPGAAPPPCGAWVALGRRLGLACLCEWEQEQVK